MPIERFYDGISTVYASNPLGMLPRTDPTTYAMFMEDFLTPVGTTDLWLHTQTNGTLAGAATGGCGIITQTLAGADNDLSQLALKSVSFLMTAGKKLFFEAKVKVDKGAAGTIGEQEVFVGLSTVQVGANFTAADGLTMAADDVLGFWSKDGTANLAAIARKTDVESIESAATTYVDATWMVLSIYFNGTTAYFYKDDNGIAALTGYPTAGLCPTLYIKAGEAKPAVLSTDYVFVAVER